MNGDKGRKGISGGGRLLRWWIWGRLQVCDDCFQFSIPARVHHTPVTYLNQHPGAIGRGGWGGGGEIEAG